MLDQEAVLVGLHFIWLLVLLVSFYVRWVANLIDLSTLRVTHRGRTVAVHSAVAVSHVSHGLFISAGILRVRFFIQRLGGLLKVSMPGPTVLSVLLI